MLACGFVRGKNITLNIPEAEKLGAGCHKIRIHIIVNALKMNPVILNGIFTL